MWYWVQWRKGKQTILQSLCDSIYLVNLLIIICYESKNINLFSHRVFCKFCKKNMHALQDYLCKLVSHDCFVSYSDACTSLEKQMANT